MTRKPMMLARLRSEPRIAQRPLKRNPEIKVAETPRVTPIRAEAPEAPPAIPAIDDNNAETPIHVFKVRANPIVLKARKPAPSPDETTDMEDSGRSPDHTVSPVLKKAPIRQVAPKHLAEARQISRPAVAASETRPPRPVEAKRKRAPAQKMASAEMVEMHDPPVIRGMPPSTLGSQARALGGTRQNFDERQFSTQSIGGRYVVQIGAYGSIDDAQRALNNALGRAGGLLAGVSSVTNPAMKDGRQIFRARFTGLDANRATSTCNALRRQSFDCFVMAGE
jgi:D-alanyl-D-alanine carboxypeptidase